MSKARNERLQQGGQLCCVGIVEPDNPHHYIFNTDRVLLRGQGGARLLGQIPGNDLEHILLFDQGITIHLQDRQKYLIDLIATDRFAGNHGHPSLHFRVDDNGLAKIIRGPVDKLSNLGIFHGQRNLLGQGRRRAGQQQAHQQRQSPHHATARSNGSQQRLRQGKF